MAEKNYELDNGEVRYKGRGVRELYLSDQGNGEDKGGDANLDSVYEDAMSRSIKTQNYKDFYNAAIQNRVFEQNSQKYLNNTLASQGLNNMGYGTSMMAGITNAANNRSSEAYDAYLQANREADQAALSRQEDNIDSLLQEIAAGGERSAELNQFLVNAGYMDPDGNYTESFNALTPAQQARIKNAMAIANAAKGNTGESATGISLDALKARTFGDDRDAQTMDAKFNYELTALNNAVNNGNIKAGEVVKMTNSNTGETAYVRYNADGTYNIVTEDDYNKAESKSEVKGGKWVKQTVQNNTQSQTDNQKLSDTFRARYKREPRLGVQVQDPDTGKWFYYKDGAWFPVGEVH